MYARRSNLLAIGAAILLVLLLLACIGTALVWPGWGRWVSISTNPPAVAAPPYAPPAPTVPVTSAPSGGAVSCMTDSDVLALYGFAPNEIIRTDAPWDSCKWVRQNLPSTINFVLKDGWGLTYTDAKGNVWVTLGKGQAITARGFTLRQPGNQVLAKGPQGYFDFEWGFGFAPERGSNTYIHCPDENMVSLVSLTAEQSQKCATQGTKPVTAGAIVAPSGSPTTGGGITMVDNSDSRCPKTPADAASLLGGTSANWTDLGVDVGRDYRKWSFNSTVFTDLRYPGWGSFDHWKFGNNYKANIPGAKDGTFNCTR